MMNNSNSQTLNRADDEQILAALIEHLITAFPTEVLGQSVEVYENGGVHDCRVNGAGSSREPNATGIAFLVGDQTVRLTVGLVKRVREPLLSMRPR